MFRNLRELYQYRALLWSLTARELRARYRASVLGFLWTFLNPTLQMLVYVVLFEVFMKQSIEHYSYFIFVGLLPWLAFASSVGAGTSSISDRRDLLTKVRFPAQVLPATVVATNTLNYLLSLPLMVGLGLALGVRPTSHAVLFPVVLAVQVLFTGALCYFLSALNVTFRDLQHLVGNVMMLWYFLTPALYPLSSIPNTATRLWPTHATLPLQELVLLLNPMAVIVTSYQAIFYEHRWPQMGPLAGVALFSLALLWMSTRLFEARREDFAENV